MTPRGTPFWTAFLIAVFFSNADLRAENHLKIAYPEFKPFFTESAQGEVQGFFADILIEALEKRMGIELAWASFPWKRCQKYVRTGKYDAMDRLLSSPNASAQPADVPMSPSTTCP